MELKIPVIGIPLTGVTLAAGYNADNVIEFDVERIQSLNLFLNVGTSVEFKVEQSPRRDENYHQETAVTVAGVVTLLERSIATTGKYVVPIPFAPYHGKMKISFKGSGTLTVDASGIKFNQSN